MKNNESIDIFISYSHKDEKFRVELEKHLASLKREGLIKPWHDRKITPGNEWASEIDLHINEAKIILLLISADFIASDYCYDREMNQAIERHSRKEAFVIPIILRPVDWSNTPFAKLQALPKNAKPVINWSRSDDAYLDIVNGIRRTIQGLQPITIPPNSEPVDSAKVEISSKALSETKDINSSFVGELDSASKAKELFNKATPLDLEGWVERALQLYRQVKELDPFYPDIDLHIRRLENEIKKGYPDQSGRVSIDRYKQQRRLSPALIATLVGVIVLITGWLGPMTVKYFSPPLPSSPTISPTSTFIPSITPIFTLAPTETVTPTATSVLAIEPPISSGYTIYDTFDKDTGVLKFTDTSTLCHNVLENGTWKFECFGSATETVKFSLFPALDDAVTTQGVEMAFYTLPIPDGKSDWGKYQLLMRFGTQCSNTPRGYVVSIRPNELTFIEVDSKSNSINPPSPKRIIGTLQPHVIRLELQNGKVNYYLDGELIRDAIPLETTIPVCWLFQSQDNNDLITDGYRGIAIMWIAIKK